MKTKVHTRRSALFMLLLALIALVALTLPYAFNLTWASPGAPEHQLTYRGHSLTWDSATDVRTDGSAKLTLFRARSADGNAVLAPGMSGHNTVRLKNTASDAVRYTAVLYRLGASNVPVRPELSGGSAAAADDLALPAGVQRADVVRAVTGTVAGNDRQDLDIDWTWPYEADVDEADTASGAQASSVTLGLYVVVEDGSTDAVMTPKTADAAPVQLALVLLAVGLLGVAVLSGWFIRRPKENLKNEAHHDPQ